MWGFVRENPAEGQLLFERTIPGFEPSPPSYSVAQSFQIWVVDKLLAAGVADAGDVDICTALVAGLISARKRTSRVETAGSGIWNRLRNVLRLPRQQIRDTHRGGKHRTARHPPSRTQDGPATTARTTDQKGRAS